MNGNGIVIAAIAFLIIGAFHPIVIKAEYHWGERCWPVFLILGLAALWVSTRFEQTLISATFGIIGGSCLWSIRELKEQTKRVEKGWFPQNPKKSKRETP